MFFFLHHAVWLRNEFSNHWRICMILVPPQGHKMTPYLSNSSFPTVYNSKMTEVRLAEKKRGQSDLMQGLIFLCPKAFEKCKTFVSIICYELQGNNVTCLQTWRTFSSDVSVNERSSETCLKGSTDRFVLVDGSRVIIRNAMF